MNWIKLVQDRDHERERERERERELVKAALNIQVT